MWVGNSQSVVQHLSIISESWNLLYQFSSRVDVSDHILKIMTNLLEYFELFVEKVYNLERYYSHCSNELPHAVFLLMLNPLVQIYDVIGIFVSFLQFLQNKFEQTVI